MSEITLQVNGNPVYCLPKSHLPQILEQLGLNPRLLAIEYNGEILHRQYWATTELQDGDRLEIVTIVGGGTEKLEITLPQTWLEQYQVLAQQSGRSVTDLLQEAIGQYIVDAQDTIFKTVKVTITSEGDDDWEDDEPDEVLTDFLPR